MKVIISYDIADNKLRADFNKFITKYGYRLQYSVYEITNGTRILNNMLLEMDAQFKKDSLKWTVFISSNCRMDVILLGMDMQKMRNKSI